MDNTDDREQGSESTLSEVDGWNSSYWEVKAAASVDEHTITGDAACLARANVFALLSIGRALREGVAFNESGMVAMDISSMSHSLSEIAMSQAFGD